MVETQRPPGDALKAIIGSGVSGFGLRRALESSVAETKRVGLIDRNACTDDLRDEVVGRCSANHPDVTKVDDSNLWFHMAYIVVILLQCFAVRCSIEVLATLYLDRVFYPCIFFDQ
jgi:hypothetical protein